MYKALLSYDGTNYFGWQKTKTGPSIQEAVEKALSRITQQSTSLTAASRTDRGVHAKGQVVQFSLTDQWDTKALKLALNGVLPVDIRVLEIHKMNFHPTLDAITKEYHYRLCLDKVQDPHERFYSWHIYHSLNPKLIEIEAQELLGTHNFSAFCNRDEEGEDNPICTIEKMEFDGATFKIRGNRFLHKMVRNLVGSLVYSATGRVSVNMKELLASKDRKMGGITAPAHGLYLHEVSYDPQSCLNVFSN